MRLPEFTMSEFNNSSQFVIRKIENQFPYQLKVSGGGGCENPPAGFFWAGTDCYGFYQNYVYCRGDHKWTTRCGWCVGYWTTDCSVWG